MENQSGHQKGWVMVQGGSRNWLTWVGLAVLLVVVFTIGLYLPYVQRAIGISGTADGVQLNKRIKVHNMEHVRSTDDTLEVRAKGDNPHFWDFANLGSIHELVLRQPAQLVIWYGSSMSGGLQVFFDVEGRGFTEDASTHVNIRNTDNHEHAEVMVTVNRGAWKGGKVTDIRIDPPDDSTFQVDKLAWLLKDSHHQLAELVESTELLKASWENIPGKDFGVTMGQRISRFQTKQRMLRAQLFHLSERIGRVEHKEKRLPNIILIVPDALNGSYLSCFNRKDGGPSAMTPNLDQLAAESLYYPNAISQGGCTPSSMTSIHSGLYVSHHGVPFEKAFPDYFLPPTLPQLLRQAGYFTGAFVGTNAPWFDHVLSDYHFVHVVDGASGPDAAGRGSIEALFEFLKSSPVQPYFIFLHIYNPHSPYTPASTPILPPDLQTYYGSLQKEQLSFVYHQTPTGLFKPAMIKQYMYLREIEELDNEIGELIDYLRSSSSGVFDWREDILIFTSDHGEEFEHENGFFAHSQSPYIETMRVPVILKGPNIQPGIMKRYTENAGIFSLLLEFARVDDPRPESIPHPTLCLPDAADEGKTDVYTYAICENCGRGSPERVPGGREMKSVIRSDGYKLIYDTLTQECRLFFLDADPNEERNISQKPEFKELLDELRAQLAARTDLDRAYPVTRGDYLGHCVPAQSIQKLFGPPKDVIEKFGTPEEREGTEKDHAR